MGNTNVAANMATTCCEPIPTVRPQLISSCGPTDSPGGGVLPPWTSFQLNMVDMNCSSRYVGLRGPSLVPRVTCTHRRVLINNYDCSWHKMWPFRENHVLRVSVHATFEPYRWILRTWSATAILSRRVAPVVNGPRICSSLPMR